MTMVGYSKHGSLQLVVEVTKAPRPTAEWAAAMRRNLLAHGLTSRAPFFLLALPTRLYLGKNDPPAGVRPHYEAEMKPLKDWLWSQRPAGAVLKSEAAIEVLLTSWFAHVMHGHERQPLGPEFDWLFESGLYDAVRLGRI